MFFYLPHGIENYGGAFHSRGEARRKAHHKVVRENGHVFLWPRELSLVAFHPENFIKLGNTFGIRKMWLVDRIRGQKKLVQIIDHRNLTGENPLAGRTPTGGGPRFPDVTRMYVKEGVGLAQCVVNTVGPERFRNPTVQWASEVAAHVALCATYAGMEVVAIGWNDEKDSNSKALSGFAAKILRLKASGPERKW